jgi:hypothetical protein
MFMVGVDISIISAVTPRITDTIRSMGDIVPHGFVYRLLHTMLPIMSHLLQDLEGGRVYFVSLLIFGSNAVKRYFTLQHLRANGDVFKWIVSLRGDLDLNCIHN